MIRHFFFSGLRPPVGAPAPFQGRLRAPLRPTSLCINLAPLVAKLPHETLSLAFRQLMGLEKIVDVDVGKPSAGQAGGKLAPDQLGKVGRDVQHDIEDNLVHRLPPAIGL